MELGESFDSYDRRSDEIEAKGRRREFAICDPFVETDSKFKNVKVVGFGEGMKHELSMATGWTMWTGLGLDLCDEVQLTPLPSHSGSKSIQR